MRGACKGIKTTLKSVNITRAYEMRGSLQRPHNPCHLHTELGTTRPPPVFRQLADERTGDGVTSRADEYRQLARDCLKLANMVPSGPPRDTLIDMVRK
jgi:hypothetical protein